jgi:hypothetical protein
MVKRTQRILQAGGATVCPESWYSFEIKFRLPDLGPLNFFAVEGKSFLAPRR